MSVLPGWPKSRPYLPDDYRIVYEEHMHRNRGGGSPLNRAALWLEAWMHRAVAQPPAQAVLELGAGGLNHVAYEPGALIYDVVEPLTQLVEGAEESAPGTAIRYLGNYEDLVRRAVKPEQRYGKVTSVAVLEHLEDLPSVVSASALLLKPGGTFAAGIPSEGGRLWAASWRMTTGRDFRRRYSLDYGVLMAWEHINTAKEIIAVTRTFFDSVHLSRFPGPTNDTSLYTAIHATQPRLATARAQLGL